LGVLAAGVGLLRYGASRGSMQSKSVEALNVFLQTQPRIVDAQLRQAAAAESNAKLVALLEDFHEQQREIGVTLRTISRKLNALMRANEEEPTDNPRS
jgi:hypothetical protein